ncbi:MAG: ribonuclease E/G [Candidatus Sifarchaeia archaeon]|jgi:Ribonuclease G/E
MEKNETAVRLRGIYSTALAKILLDHGFKLTYPSTVILQRFKGAIEDLRVPFDIDIFDRRNRQGVELNGKEETIEELLEILRSLLPDLTVFYTKVSPNGFYKGTVTRINFERGYAILNLGRTEGILYLNNDNFHEEINEGDELLVRVEKVRPGLPEVQPSITIAGRYAVLIPENAVRISHKIRGKKRDELFFLGKTIKPDSWGILWRTAAASEDVTALIAEIEDLKKLAQMIFKKAEKTKAPAAVYEENITTFLEFPNLSKVKLDELRSEVVATVRNHHQLKVMGHDLSLLVDFGERILAKLPEHYAIINEAADFTFFEIFPSLDSEVCIDHVKFNGRTIFLSPGYVIKSDPNERKLLLKRMFKAGRKFDGLDLPKEAGDYGVMEIKEGEFFVKTTYFSRDGIYKGEYFNINTPVEVYPGLYPEPHRIRYVDLEVDLVRTEDFTRVIDLEKLEYAKEESIISEQLFNLTMEKMSQLKSMLRTEDSSSTAK